MTSELSFGESVSRVVSALCFVLVLIPKPDVVEVEVVLKEMIQVIETVLNAKATLSTESLLTFLTSCKKQRKVWYIMSNEHPYDIIL